MASDDVKKLVSEQMPGFEAVSRPDRSRQAGPPDERSRPASDWKAKLERGKPRSASPGGADAAGGGAPAGHGHDAGQTDAPSRAESRDAFFGSGDPRERLRSRAAKRYQSDSGDQADGRSVIVQVRPTDPQTDSARPATPKAVVIRGKKIVGTQG